MKMSCDRRRAQADVGRPLLIAVEAIHSGLGCSTITHDLVAEVRCPFWRGERFISIVLGEAKRFNHKEYSFIPQRGDYRGETFCMRNRINVYKRSHPVSPLSKWR
jgi:hypothetical protein